MKKKTKSMLLTAALTIGLSAPAWAANVPVTLPDFPVTLNGTVIENSYRQYPLLVYKNITYFPTTYYDCRFLGVETAWTQQSGLQIDKTKLTGAYHQQNNSKQNGSRATAQIATGKITVNGKTIENDKEPYPLLIYRDVTYFPLTWRFAVNEFGWKYQFTQQAGLTIDAGNTKTSSATIPDYRKGGGKEHTTPIFRRMQRIFIIRASRALSIAVRCLTCRMIPSVSSYFMCHLKIFTTQAIR